MLLKVVLNCVCNAFQFTFTNKKVKGKKEVTYIGHGITLYSSYRICSLMESVIKASSTEVNLPSHCQVTEGSILKAVLLFQLFS